MKPLTVPFKGKSVPDLKASIFFHSRVMTSQSTINYSFRIPKIMKDYPIQVANALAKEIRNPLDHINLSVEMLESIVKDNDFKLYLDVIKRNSIRINNLINEFLTYRQANAQVDVFSINRLSY